MKRLILKTSYREGILIPLTLSDEMVVALLEATKVKQEDGYWGVVGEDNVDIIYAEVVILPTIETTEAT